MLRSTIAAVRRTSVRAYTTSLEQAAKQTGIQIQQAPNFVGTWSKSQRSKDSALSGPRFEQFDLATQPNPMAAIELIAEEPIQFVSERVTSCNGGGGALGHPKVYINLDKPGAHACGYCGVRFEMNHHH
ncbi:zinc-finger domain-containing protein [Phycomyces nitens]|nr:zinc-finger domain-containing protein [Phycomyces nitens]